MAELPPLDLVETFFRFSGLSLFCLLGVLILRDFENRQIAWLGAWASVSGAAYLICTSPALNIFFGPGMLLVQIFCHSGQIAIWLFSLSQFRDKLSLWPTYILIALAFYIWQRLYFDWLRFEDTVIAMTSAVLYTATRFGLIAHMLYVAWDGRGDDLVESRRRFRTIYIVTVSIAVLTVVISETVFDQQYLQNDSILLFQSLGMWLLSAVLVWQITNLRTGALFTGVSEGRRTQIPPANDPNERHDLATVERLIEADQLYLQPGLTIAGLATEAGLPEHRLRRLINTHLGYRNFADFLNHYRIAAAKERLSSVAERNIPVLTIAMDMGYGSLGPFNRAFKERTGLTPTEFRKKTLADS
jgi:AraC-like DNA-binding protein